MYYNNIFNSKRVNGSVSLGAADPFIIKVNGYYYLTCTKSDGLILMKSFDLIHWENVNEDGVVGVDETLKHAYAPEICYMDGYFYAVASPLQSDKSNDLTPYHQISYHIYFYTLHFQYMYD